MISYAPAGSEITVNSTYARRQIGSDVTQLADGRFVVTWVDMLFSTADQFVRAQIFEADGTPVGGELTLSATGGTYPTVAGLAGGGFVAAWYGSGGIVAQVYDDAGAAVGASFTVAASSGAHRPSLAALADGGFAVSWHEDRLTGGDTSGSGVHVRSYDAAGTATSPDLLANTTTAGDQKMTSLAALAGGGWVVSWYNDNPAPGGDNSYQAQIFDAAGAPVGGELVISEPGFVSENYVPVTALANGNFAAAWFQSDAENNMLHRIQIYSPTGAQVGTQIQVPVSLGMTQLAPTLAALADGSLALVWLGDHGDTTDGSGKGVFVQVYDPNGTAFGAPLQVNTQASGDQVDPSIVGLADGGFVVTWTDVNGTGSDDDEIKAQVFGRSGSIDPLAIASNGGGEAAAVAVDENGLAAATVAATGGFGTIGYAIAGGADAARFVIDTATGALSFAAVPDFEAPADADGDNVYEVVVAASDGTRSDSQTLSITVADVNEAPRIVSDGGGTSAALALDEGAIGVTVVAAEDADGPGAPTYSIIDGADAALFAIDAATGALNFLAAPDYEAPADEGADNFYNVTVAASDGTLSSFQAISILIGDVNEPAFEFEATEFEEWENYSEGAWLGIVGGDEFEGVAYAITGGADAALFELSAEDGYLVLAPQDY